MKLYYNGDINIEHGGYFYNLDNVKWGYVDVVRVTPCSDVGAPDNQFWVDRLVVNLKTDPVKLQEVLDTCGYTMEEANDNIHMLVDAHVASGAYDQDFSECVQIGAKPDPFHDGRWDNVPVDKVLRGNTSLRNYTMNIAKGKYA